MTARRPLSPADLEVLEFERSTTGLDLGRKEAAIFHRFAHSGTRYQQRLLTLIDTPAAEAYDPMLIRRLRRLRDARRANRSTRANGFEVAR